MHRWSWLCLCTWMVSCSLWGYVGDERLTFDRPQQELEVTPRLRLAADVLMRSEGQSLNLTGLDELRLSGSGQFSASGLRSLLELLEPYAPAREVILLDLRAERHGFLNGIPVGWRPVRLENPPPLLSPSVLRREETVAFQALRRQPEVTVWFFPRTLWTGSLRVPVEEAWTEPELARRATVRYGRLPLLMEEPPLTAAVDRLVRIVRALGPKEWLHVHDQRGTGRATMVMTMVDMMHNARDVPFEDILSRQFLLGGVNLTFIPWDPARDPKPFDRHWPPSAIYPPYRNDVDRSGFNPLFQNNPENPFFIRQDPMSIGIDLPGNQWGSPEAAEDRLTFLREFYAYCRASSTGHFRVLWSQWLRSNIQVEVNPSSPAAAAQ